MQSNVVMFYKRTLTTLHGDQLHGIASSAKRNRSCLLTGTDGATSAMFEVFERNPFPLPFSLGSRGTVWHGETHFVEVSTRELMYYER